MGFLSFISNNRKNQKLEQDFIIEHVIKLYLLLIQKEKIHQTETKILYKVISHLFRTQNIPREYLEGKILESSDTINKIAETLNKKLNKVDKIRILISYIVITHSDCMISEEEIIQIIDLAKMFDLDKNNFKKIIDHFHYETKESVSYLHMDFIHNVKETLFDDFLFFGIHPSCAVEFKSSDLAPIEFFTFVINNNIFILTGNDCHAYINGEKLLSDRLYIFPNSGMLKLGKIHFRKRHLLRLYDNQLKDDIINLEKPDYKFRMENHHNRVSIIVQRGTIYKNNKRIPKNKSLPIRYDDIVQIKNYQPFNILDILDQRRQIGTHIFNPDEIYINSGPEFYTSFIEEADSLLRIFSQDNKFYIDEPLKKSKRIYLNGKALEKTQPFKLNKDVITINRENYTLSSLFDLNNNPFEIKDFNVYDIGHRFKDGKKALNHINFDAHKNDMIAIMGPSGSGKTTLLKTIATDIIPQKGSIFINDKNLFKNLNFFKQHIGYVPQDDILISELTVYENLFFRGKLRTPNIAPAILDKKIRNILLQLNLSHRIDSRVGNEMQNFLSGGERKRLNIALELLYEPSILICDEPTSGLSSTDSEQIIKILRDLTKQGKIVLTTIHQPSSSVFQHYDKVLLMDKGGRQVFYGDLDEAFEYFSEELREIDTNKEMILNKKEIKSPDFFFDIIQYPEYDDNNEVAYEQVDQNMVIKRKFNGDYWTDKYHQLILYDIISKEKRIDIGHEEAVKKKRKRGMDFKSHLKQLLTFFKRDLLVRFRNKSNTYITFLEAPLLALLVGFILHLSGPAENYSFYRNPNISIYLFISIIIFIFLGLSNSIEEIMSVKRIFLRERKFNIRIFYFLLSKLFALSVFAAFQVVLYYIVSSFILEIKGIFFMTILYFFAAAFIGFSIGLFFSCFIKNSKAIINILPIILIPQIIFGGAIIKYEKMNKELTISKQRTIPEIVQLIPSKWLFEGLLTTYGTLNIIDKKFTNLEEKRVNYLKKYKNGELSSSEYRKNLSKIYKAKEKVAEKYPQEKFQNKEINLIVNIMNGKFYNTEKNVFLASQKSFLGENFKTYYFNLTIIFLYIILINIFSYFKLKYFYKE